MKSCLPVPCHSQEAKEKRGREREIPLPSQNAKFFSGEISHSLLEMGCQYCTVDKNQGQAIISYHRKLGEQGLPGAISHRFWGHVKICLTWSTEHKVSNPINSVIQILKKGESAVGFITMLGSHLAQLRHKVLSWTLIMTGEERTTMRRARTQEYSTWSSPFQSTVPSPATQAGDCYSNSCANPWAPNIPTGPGKIHLTTSLETPSTVQT